MKHFTKTFCSKCEKSYFYFQERFEYSMRPQEYYKAKDPISVLRSVFQKIEKFLVNPLYMSYFQDNYNGNIVLIFIEGISECPHCDTKEIQNQKSKTHYGRINDLVKSMRPI